MQTSKETTYKNFKLITKDVPVGIFLREIQDNEDAWSDVRSKVIPLHKDTSNIFLRNVSPVPHVEVDDNRRTRNTSNYEKFKLLTAWLEEFAADQGGTLQRAQIVKLKRDGKVGRHWDSGDYYAWSDRYHLVLQSEGSVMLSGDETVVWHEGEVWWFENKKMHEAFHKGEKERIHVIFDIESMGSYWRLVKRTFLRWKRKQFPQFKVL